ncbi:MAG: PorV/PorQ family protein [Bacteroidia bacterium]|nr:PorV/PorQ family protein [Bacteroidia bacterium]
MKELFPNWFENINWLVFFQVPNTRIWILLIGLVGGRCYFSKAQSSAYNYIRFTEDFLSHPNDIESNGMAGLGMVSSNPMSMQGISHNPALLAKKKKYWYARINNSFTKTSLFNNDLDLTYLSGAVSHGFDSLQGLALDFNYYGFGYIAQYDSVTSTLNKYYSRNYSVGIRYARQITSRCKVGLGLKYFYTNYGVGFKVNGKDIVAQGIATDWGINWSDNKSLPNGNRLSWGIGIMLQNMGPKVGIPNLSVSKAFLPQNFRLGANLCLLGKDLPNSLHLVVGYELNKWLVPTPPLRNGSTIIKGKDNNVSSFVGTFQSFADAPFGFKEELAEINHLLGLELHQKVDKKWFWAVRGGYSHSPKSKGGIPHFTLGATLAYREFSLACFVKINPDYKTTIVDQPLGFQLAYFFDR